MNNKIIIGLTFIMLLIHCSSVSRAIKDRGNDALDIFELNIAYSGIPTTIPFFQAQAIVSNKKFGFSFPGVLSEQVKWGFGLRSGEVGSFKYRDLSILINMGEISESITDDSEKIRRMNFRQKNYCGPATCNMGNSPAMYTRLGADVGFILEVHVAFNPGELLDFFLGFLGVDIYDDDFHHAVSKDQIEEQ
jgi:hypothetical protein